MPITGWCAGICNILNPGPAIPANAVVQRDSTVVVQRDGTIVVDQRP